MPYELPGRRRDEANITRYEAFTAMEKVGGGFMSTLGTALSKADGTNTRRIMKTWETEIREVVEIHREDQARKGVI